MSKASAQRSPRLLYSSQLTPGHHALKSMVALSLEAKMDTEIFTGRIDRETYQKLFSMQAGPDKQALYLLNLYETDALKLAEDCRDILIEMEDHETAEYWREVCACIKRLTIKH